jgi:hypothetical protein
MLSAKKSAILFLLLLCAGATVYSQVLPTTPPVYMSGGPTIYTVASGTISSIFTSANANFESLAIGPDNVDADPNGNAKYAFFLYACDPAGTITRIAFLPAATPNTPPTVAGSETVYSGGVAGLAPVCGRSSSAGDFYITNKSGSGVYVFSGIASVGFGSLSASSPTLVTLNPKLAKNMTGRGITQKYVGDLLFVDNFDNQVLRSPYGTPFATQSTFISNLNGPVLNGPVGLAAAVTTTLNPATGVFVPNSNFFVANSNSNTSKILPAQPPVSVFTFNDATQTVVPAVCPGLNFPKGNNQQVADYLASAPTADALNTVISNTIYLVSNTNNSGSLWSWNTSQGQGAQPNCSLSLVASIGTPLSGVAVGPAPVTLNLQVNATAANPTPTNFNFNSSLFQLTANGCTASVTAYPLSLATVNSMINAAQLPGGDTNAINNQYPMALFPPPLLNPAIPLANLGDGGFETAYVAHWAPGFAGTCTTVFPDGGFVTGIFNFLDSTQYTNPRAVQCDNANPTTEPQMFPPSTTTCGSPEPLAVYPLGGPIAGDLGTKTNSVFAMVAENLNTQTDTFCGFQSPLLNSGDPGYPFSFPAGSRNTINVKFKLSSSANCKQNFITNASALLSVAQICANASSDPTCGPNGSPVFNAINVLATASSLDVVPLFNEGNQQYSFTLTVGTLPPGTYSLTVTFLTNNTKNQTILFLIT